MGPKTLFEAAKPIIYILNFMGYGLGWEKKKGGEWVKGLLKWVLKINATVVFAIFFLFSVTTLFLYEFDSKCTYLYYTVRGQMFLLGLPCLDYFLLLNQTRLENLVRQFRLFLLMKESGKAVGKCLQSFYFYLAINMIFLLYFLWRLRAIVIDRDVSIMDTCSYFWFFPSLFLLALFPVFLCYFACLVPIYCVARVKELVQEVKGARSSLRRAKMTSDLMREYYQLKRLASMTDETVSKAMSLFHTLFVMVFALTAATVDSAWNVVPKFKFYGYLLGPFVPCSIILAAFFVHIFPFLMYKRVAPLANEMHLLIFETLVNTAFIDDECLSRDPLLQPLLIKMRVSRVLDVSHIVLGEAAFTHFGEAIEVESLFTIFLEAFDMYNTVSAPARHLSVSLGLEITTVNQCRTNLAN